MEDVVPLRTDLSTSNIEFSELGIRDFDPGRAVTVEVMRLNQEHLMYRAWRYRYLLHRQSNRLSSMESDSNGT